MSSILILLYLIFYLILAKIRLDLAVMLILAALPSYLIRFQILGIPFTVLEAMILISFAVWLIFHTEFKNFIRGKYGWKKFQKNRKERIKYPLGIEIILLLIVSFIAIAVAGFSDSALGIWKAYFLEPVLLFILVLNIFQISNKKPGFLIKKILWPLAISMLVISIVAIFQKITGLWIFNELWAAEETRRVTSFFGYPNAVGLYLGPIIMVMVGWLSTIIARSNPALAGERRSNLVSIAAISGLLRRFLPAGRQKAPRNDRIEVLFIGLTIVLSLLSIYFAKSEGALVGLLAGFMVFGLLANKKSRWATVVLIIFLSSAILLYSPTRDYAIDKLTLRDLSGEIRKQQWRETWQMLRDGRFVTGAGLANYQKAIAPYHQEGIFFNQDNDPEFHRHIVWNKEYHKAHWQPVETYLYPHNILLNFWTELGLAGMLLFIWIIVKFWVMGAGIIRNSNVASEKYLVIGLMCSIVVIVIHGLVDAPYFKNDLAVMFWLLAAMINLYNLKITKPYLAEKND